MMRSVIMLLAVLVWMPTVSLGQQEPVAAPAAVEAAAPEAAAPATPAPAEGGTSAPEAPAAESGGTPDIAEMMRYLASDELEGRQAGAEGSRKAADYIARQFAAAGLLPSGDEGTWFQNFTLGASQIIGDDCAMKLQLEEDGRPEALGYANDYMPFRFSAAGDVAGPVVFAGYGISSEEHKYDDYAGLDVKGKIVLLLRYEPGERDEKSPFNGLQHTQHATFASKIALAQKLGASAVLVASGPLYHPRGEGFYASASGAGIDVTIPVVQISQTVAREMFKAAGRDLLTVQKGIDEKLQPDSFVLAGCRVGLTVSVDRVERKYRNVVGCLPGSDASLKAQVVVVGAHYDHIGTAFGYGIRKTSDLIYNGADDNASGTVAIIAAARQLASAPQKPKRTILFIAFDGEEQGLFGSRHYVENPVVPLDRTVGMINLDMVGRAVNSSVYAYFSRSADSLREPLEKFGESRELKVMTRYGEFMPTDSASFASVGVPTVAFITGMHADYHGVGDTADKINLPVLEKIAQTTADLVNLAAEDPKLKRGPSMVRRGREVEVKKSQEAVAGSAVP